MLLWCLIGVAIGLGAGLLISIRVVRSMISLCTKDALIFNIETEIALCEDVLESLLKDSPRNALINELKTFIGVRGQDLKELQKDKG